MAADSRSPEDAARKGYAAYYTKKPVAHLLASLLIGREGFSRACDFACGSGTLLRAVQSVAKSVALEPGEVWGFEAQRDAVKAAKGLRGATIVHVPVTAESLGSLALWYVDRLEEKPTPEFDVVIMNPPYSRATAPGRTDSRPRLFDFVPEEAFLGLWTAYSALLRDMEASARGDPGVHALYEQHVGDSAPFARRNVDPLYAGTALPFFLIGDRYLRIGGRLGLVLPRAALEGSSFFLLRAILATRYELDFVVLSAELGQPNFSEATDFSEILLVARKTRAGGKRTGAVRVVTIYRQPQTDREAKRLAGEIERGRGHTGDLVVRRVKRQLIREFAWNFSIGLMVPSEISDLIEGFSDDALFGEQVHWRRFPDLPVTYANPRQFRGREFARRFEVGPGSLRLLPRTGVKAFHSLVLKDHGITRLVARNEEAKRFYSQAAGRLIVPEAVRFDSTPLLAVWSPFLIASSRAHMIRSKPAIEKALCAWLNSTFAIAYLRAAFTTIDRAFGHVYRWHLRMLPVPDLRDPLTVRRLAGVFRSYAGEHWPSLPTQYRGFSSREAYDAAVFRAVASRAPPHDALPSLYAAMRSFL